MITLNLIGGLRYSIGYNKLFIDKPATSVSEILEILNKNSKNKKITDNSNIMISINGIDSNVLGGTNALVTEKDRIVAVTIVHGG